MAFSAMCAAAAIGLNVHLPPNDTLDLAKELGGEWVRIDFNWDVAEPSQGKFDWTIFDAVIDGANARGLNVFATIGYGPAWASTGNLDGAAAGNDVPNATAYKSFVKAATARYADGRVKAWGTWNEPNLAGFFEGTKQQWIDNAFVPAVDAIKEGCPSCLVVGPELATISDKYADYLDAALTARGNDLDVVSWHIYAAFPEDDPQAGLTKDSFYNKLDAHRIVKVGTTVVYEGQLSVKEVLDKRGFSNLPVWITETGEEAEVGKSADLEAQRKYIERLMQAVSTRSWWQRMFVYELSEEHPNGVFPDSHWGLALRVADPDATYTDNFQRKPVFDDLKTCIATGVAGSSGAGGASAGGASGSGGTASGGTTGKGGSTGTGATASGGASAGSGDDEGGCGCRAARSEPTSLWVALGALVFAIRPRRRYGQPG